MRELSECKAEIFHRSEEKIKKIRRKRKRIIALCVPLCLVVTVLSFTFLPSVINGKNNINEVECIYKEIVISGSVDTQKITDKAEISKIYDTVYSINKTGDIFDNKFENADVDNFNYDQSATADRQDIYIITFIAEDSSKTVYILTNNKLQNLNDSIKTTLTNEKVSELKEILGISD